jgi:nucleotide-binding universal stress UspA family protein
MKILIGYDGSEHANAALEDLRRAGLPGKAQAILMSVPQSAMLDPTLSKWDNRGFEREPYLIEDVEKTAAIAREASDLIRRNFPAWEVRSDLGVGSITRILAKKARQWNPNLLVIGLDECFLTPGRAQFGGLSQRHGSEVLCSFRPGPPI